MRQLAKTFRLPACLLAAGLVLAGCGGGSAGAPPLTAQTISFAGPGNQTVGVAAPALVATASSGLAVTITSTTPAVCTVSGSTLTLVSAGTCTLDASQAGNTTYAAASDVSVSITVAPAPLAQTITFPSPGNQTLGTAAPALSATASSGLPVSIASTTTSICTVSGSTLTLVAAGSCSLTATEAGDSTYAAATPVTDTFIVAAQGVSSVNFSSGFAAGNLTVEGGAFGGYSGSNIDGYGCGGAATTSCGSGGSFVPTVTAANSGFYYYYQTQAPATGEYVGLYVQAPGVTNGISGSGNTPGVQLTNQTSISFTFGENPEWFASATNNFGVLLTLGKYYNVGTTATPAACNIKLLKVVHPTAAAATNYTLSLSSFTVTQNCGVAGLTATQALALSPVSQIDFQGDGGASALSDGTLSTGANLSVANTATPPVYPTTLVVNGPIVFQGGSAGPQAQTITFPSPGNQVLGTAPITLTASSSSGLPVSIASTTTSVCTVSGSTVTLVAAGACSLTATQAGNTAYSAATPVMQTFTVSAGSAVVNFSSGFAAANLTVEGGAFGGYSGSNIDGYGCGGAATTSCGSGGSFVPTVTAPNSGFYYYYQTQAPATGEYVGVYVQAPGLTTGISGSASTPGVQLTTQTTMTFNVGENPEWFASATNNFGVILTLGKYYNVGTTAAPAACNIKLLKVVHPTAAAGTSYTLNLSSFTVTQNCGVAGLTATQALALSPVSQVDFQGDGGASALSDGTLSTGANLSVANTASPPLYPTTLVVNGGISFQ